jgi:amino acid transporter
MSFATLLFGKPLATEEAEGERVGSLAGVAILGLDALASAAYGPEALLTILLPLGMRGLEHVTPLTLLIVGLLVIVFVSYRQTIDAYPGGGGAYTVAKENLGTTPAILAAASLSLDYVLNVAVAISAGVGALVSMVPALLPHTLSLCLGVLALLTLTNLRGVRTTGNVFMAPTYVFVGCLLTVLGIGVAQTLASGGHPAPHVTLSHERATESAASLWLLSRAFASGCTAMTGVEAVSNGVPIFRNPSTVGARRTLALIIGILAILILGISFLCRAYGVIATIPGSGRYESVLSRVVSAAVGRGPFYYLTLGSVVSVLALSANTSFAGFPRLCRILASDRFLPEVFMHQGRRLAFSHGILVLSAVAGTLLVVFRGVTDSLIPLFAVGAFLAFTTSQAGMVAHWKKRQSRHAKKALVQNAVGAVATGATALVVLASKFTEGAWISALLILGLMLLLHEVRRHYDFVTEVTSTDATLEACPPRPLLAVVPVQGWDTVSLKALAFAVSLAPKVVAVEVLSGDRDTEDLRSRWHDLVEQPARRLGTRPPELVVLRSEYRRLFAPLVDFVTGLARAEPDRQIAVVIPELVDARWYHYFLHNRTASLLKAILLLKGGPQIVIVSAPWYLDKWAPERSRLFGVRAGKRRKRLRTQRGPAAFSRKGPSP